MKNSIYAIKINKRASRKKDTTIPDYITIPLTDLKTMKNALFKQLNSIINPQFFGVDIRKQYGVAYNISERYNKISLRILKSTLQNVVLEYDKYGNETVNFKDFYILVKSTSATFLTKYSHKIDYFNNVRIFTDEDKNAIHIDIQLLD